MHMATVPDELKLQILSTYVAKLARPFHVRGETDVRRPRDSGALSLYFLPSFRMDRCGSASEFGATPAFQMIAKFSYTAGAFPAHSWRPASEMERQFTDPNCVRVGGDVSFLIGA